MIQLPLLNRWTSARCVLTIARGDTHVDCSIGSVWSVSNVRCGLRSFLLFSAKDLVAECKREQSSADAANALVAPGVGAPGASQADRETRKRNPAGALNGSTEFARGNQLRPECSLSALLSTTRPAPEIISHVADQPMPAIRCVRECNRPASTSLKMFDGATLWRVTRLYSVAPCGHLLRTLSSAISGTPILLLPDLS